jgi:hypothetical protein
MAYRPFANACCTTPAAMCFWAAAFVVLYGACLVLRSVWPSLEGYGDTPLLAALGTACFINFGRNRTLHCGITGPIFILGAVAVGLIEAGAWAFEQSAVWGFVLIAVGSPSSSNGGAVGRIEVHTPVRGNSRSLLRMLAVTFAPAGP